MIPSDVKANEEHYQQQEQQQATFKHVTSESTEPFKEKPKLKLKTGLNRKGASCEVLLNTFQIKKKKYRVLLNDDHFVWEAFDLKQEQQHQQPDPQHNLEKPSSKETEAESEHLSSSATYGRFSNVVHINEIIRVNKGPTKSIATKLRNEVSRESIPPTTPLKSETLSQSPIATPPLATPTLYSSLPLDQYLCIHYAERIVASATDCNRWKIRSLVLYNNDSNIIRQWHAILCKRLEEIQPQRIKNLLVFINPYGGKKQGLQMYEQHCKNLFLLAGIDPSCIISQRANQIRDILMTHDLTQYDAVCCVGGDGTVAEVINGLLFRAMSDHQMDFQKPDYIPKPSLPLGIIPAGSTDTIAYSLHGTSDVRTAAIHLILGRRRGLDVSSVRNRNGIIRFCASVLSYGYLGDVAAKSEKYRWMGTKRYEYTGVKAFLLNRGYEAEIRILMPDDDTDVADSSGKNDEQQASTSSNAVNKTTPATPPNSPDSVCLTNCQRCSLASTLQHRFSESGQSFADCYSDEEEEDKENAARTPQLERTDPNRASNVFRDIEEPDDKTTSITSVAMGSPSPDVVLRNKMDEHYLKLSAHSNGFSSTPFNSNMSPQLNPSNSNNNNSNTNNNRIKTIKGKFFMITGANITCACSRSPNGISRYCHLGDGYMDLILVRKTSMINNIKFLLNTVGRNGDIRNLPFVEVYRTRQFCFRTLNYSENETNSLAGSTQPITDPYNSDIYDEKVSRWNCDGEVVHDLDIIMASHCQLVDVFMRGPYAYEKPKSNEVKRSFFCCCRRS